MNSSLLTTVCWPFKGSFGTGTQFCRIALTLLLLAVKKLHKKQRQKQSNCGISYGGNLGTRLHIMGLTTQHGPHSQKKHNKRF